MDYAIIQLSGKQFKVAPGDTLTVDRLDVTPDENLVVEDVLLVGVGEKSTIGTPLVKNAKVTLKIKDHSRSKKILVSKFKSKSRYRKAYGHRQHQTVLEVLSISA
ncbi:MAG: 50S ribosomal protein L21 [Microgenomates group bacterium]